MRGQVALSCEALTAVVTRIRLGRRRRHCVGKVRVTAVVYICARPVQVLHASLPVGVNGDVNLDPVPLEQAVCATVYRRSLTVANEIRHFNTID